MISAPERRWICEAQKPGKPSHEFETFGEEAARAMCDLQGWDFIRCYQEGSHSDRPEKEKAPALLIISKQQLKCLIIEAQDTYRQRAKLGIEQPAFDEWRAAELRNVAKVDSFKILPNAKFMKVRNHFRNLRGAAALGNSYEAKRQSKERGDTLETRQQQMYLIAQALGNHARFMEMKNLQAATITVGYLLTIARAKNKAHTIQDIDDLVKLPTSRLEQLLYTIRNRIAAKEGRGDKSNRNKGQ